VKCSIAPWKEISGFARVERGKKGEKKKTNETKLNIYINASIYKEK